jgi:hypothetical protein
MRGSLATSVEHRLSMLGATPDRAALASALACVADDPDVYDGMAYIAAQRWPRAMLEVLLPRANATTLDRLLDGGALAFERQPPMPSKLAYVAEPLEVHAVPDGTALTLHRAAPVEVIDSVVTAAGSALVQIQFWRSADATWSEDAWKNLDRTALRRLRISDGRGGARCLLDGASGLEELDVYQDDLDDDRVPSTLRSLRLRGTRDQHLRSSLPHALAGCRSLGKLDIAPSVDDADIAALATLPLVDAVFWNSRCGDEGARALGRCVTLATLIIPGGTIGDEGARAIATLPAVRRLWLDRNRIGAAGASALASMRTLEDLLLDDNLIDDAGARALVGLRGLRSVSLIGNPLTDPDALREVLAPVARDVHLVFGDRLDGFGSPY